MSASKLLELLLGDGATRCLRLPAVKMRRSGSGGPSYRRIDPAPDGEKGDVHAIPRHPWLKLHKTPRHAAPLRVTILYPLRRLLRPPGVAPGRILGSALECGYGKT